MDAVARSGSRHCDGDYSEFAALLRILTTSAAACAVDNRGHFDYRTGMTDRASGTRHIHCYTQLFATEVFGPGELVNVAAAPHVEMLAAV